MVPKGRLIRLLALDDSFKWSIPNIVSNCSIVRKMLLMQTFELGRAY
jgi:hypothetical protein